MKITKEEHLAIIKASIKVLKGDLRKVTKAEIAEDYVADVTWLMRELAKAGKGLRLGDTKIKV